MRPHTHTSWIFMYILSYFWRKHATLCMPPELKTNHPMLDRVQSYPCMQVFDFLCSSVWSNKNFCKSRSWVHFSFEGNLNSNLLCVRSEVAYVDDNIVVCSTWVELSTMLSIGNVHRRVVACLVNIHILCHFFWQNTYLMCTIRGKDQLSYVGQGAKLSLHASFRLPRCICLGVNLGQTHKQTHTQVRNI